MFCLDAAAGGEATTQRHEEAADGEVQGRGGAGLRGRGQGVALPPLTRDAQSLLRALPVQVRDREDPAGQSM